MMEQGEQWWHPNHPYYMDEELKVEIDAVIVTDLYEATEDLPF